MPEHDLILRGGHVIDPAHGHDTIADVAIAGGRISAIGPSLTGAAAHEQVVEGLAIIPGIVDMHVHLSPWLGGTAGHRMLARAGVTTALDMAGPIDGVVEIARTHGAGLNVACINYARPGHTVASTDPGEGELRDLFGRAMAQGALGVKLLGGHFPMTPEATGRAIAIAEELGAYVAFHAGTTQHGSDIAGMAEACLLAEGRPLHLAHINSYTRGLIRDAVDEGEEALRLLAANPNILSESYLSPINGTAGTCSDGVPESRQTRTWLEVGGFPPTEAGLADAIAAGWALLNVERDGAIALESGEAAVATWRAAGTRLGVSFRANPPEPRLRLATARRPDGQFAVDALATDGGGIPRNVIVPMGLALVRLEAWSMADFVQKACRAPAAALGLAAKGHLGIGADADITILDLERSRAVQAIVGGETIMRDGAVTGRGTRLVTTPAGVQAARSAGIAGAVVAPGTMLKRPAPCRP